MQQIFNEGRVIGLSAYEVYVRHHMEEFGDDPKNPPASERAWLASNLSIGSSVLIKVSSDMTSASNVNEATWSGQDAEGGSYWGVEIKLPQKCRLTASSNVIASMFIGEGHLDADNKPFCDSVTDYGFLSTKNGKSNYDAMSLNPASARHYDTQLKEYAKLIDGVVIQPCKDYTNYVPDLHDSPKIRLLFRNKVTTAFYLMLSGFTDCSVISGTSIYATGLYERRPETGDFIGPVQYPWSSKIIITTPSAIISRLFVNKFMRKLYTDKSNANYSGVTNGTSPQKVTEDAFLDYNHSYMPNFYDNNPYSALAEKKARLQENVTQYSPLGEGINQLAVVSKDNGKYDLPSPYASRITSQGDKFVYPLDCAAPGTIKAYPPETSNEEFSQFPINRPGSYPVLMNDDGTMVRVIIKNGTVYKVPVADMEYKTYSNEANGRYAIIRIGSKGPNGNYVNKWVQVPVIRHLDDGKGELSLLVANDSANIYQKDYPSQWQDVEINDSDIPANFVSLRNLSNAMYTNRRLDLLGNAMRAFRNSLRISKYPNANPSLSRWDTSAGSNGDGADGTKLGECVSTNTTVRFEQDAIVNGTLMLKLHGTRANGCLDTDIYGAPAELHIDAMPNRIGQTEYGTGGSNGLGLIRNFAIGIGQNNNNNNDGDNRRRIMKNSSGGYETGNRGIMPNAAGYITMLNGLRFYISSAEPIDSDIPNGSIGIGWGMD